MSSAKVEGLKELEAKVRALSEVTAKRNLDAAGKAALEPIVDAAKRYAHYSGEKGGDPHLRDRIVSAVAKPKDANIVSVTVIKIKKGGKAAKPLALANRTVAKVLKNRGVSKAASKRLRKTLGLFAKNPRRYWHLVEFGTRRTKAYPFIRPAADENWEKSLTIYREEARKRIERAARGAGT